MPLPARPLARGDVYTATRLDADLPDGWPVRVLAGLESLAAAA